MVQLIYRMTQTREDEERGVYIFGEDTYWTVLGLKSIAHHLV